MIKRVCATACGEVQAVGYREYVRKATFSKNIFGFVRNLDSGDVEIVAEGREEDLKRFLEDIQVSEYPIDVRSFHVTWYDASGEFRKFEIIRGDRDQELFERIDVAGTLLYKIMDNTSVSLQKQDQMLVKQDQMLNLQYEVVDEVKGLRGDFKTYLDTEFSDIKRKMQSIEDALNRAGIQV